jgi:hypothetical protein
VGGHTDRATVPAASRGEARLQQLARRKVYQPIARKVDLPPDLRGSNVSLLAAAGYTLLEVLPSRRA